MEKEKIIIGAKPIEVRDKDGNIIKFEPYVFKAFNRHGGPWNDNIKDESPYATEDGKNE